MFAANLLSQADGGVRTDGDIRNEGLMQSIQHIAGELNAAIVLTRAADVQSVEPVILSN